MKNISIDRTRAKDFYTNEEFADMLAKAEDARVELLGRMGEGSDFLGWLDLPTDYDRKEFEAIKEAAAKIRRDSDILLVIGIGGSYLGARAAIEYLRHSFYNCGSIARDKHDAPQIYFVGNQISGTYLAELMEVIEGKDWSINVISKSGTTTECSIAFRIFREALENKYGKDGAARRIYATTDRKKGALKTLADAQGYRTFVVPDDVGGRFSVFTAVGLLPIAASGADIDKLMEGAEQAYEVAFNNEGEECTPLVYAALRNLFMEKGKSVEILANYEPSMHYISEWWKQLFGESEGKDGKGIYPASVDLTTDLHSMGQFIQDGTRLMFETILCVDEPREQVVIPEDADDPDGLNYIAGKTMDFVNKNAMEGTMMAHNEGGVPNILIHIPDTTEQSLGELFFFFEFACGVSGYMLGVNPFDQPGVESYKKNMFKLLGKPGY